MAERQVLSSVNDGSFLPHVGLAPAPAASGAALG